MPLNQNTIKLVEAMSQMETTETIATEWDKVVNECGNVNGSAEVVASVIIAMTRCGKGTLTILDPKN